MQSAEEIELERIHNIWNTEYPRYGDATDIVLFCDRILTMLNALREHSNNMVKQSIQGFANHINFMRNAYITHTNHRGRVGRRNSRNSRNSRKRSTRSRRSRTNMR
jgi:hypothetical protein